MSFAPPIESYPLDQRLLMQSGGRWDLTGPWQLLVFSGDPGGLIWRKQGVEHGSRDEMAAREPILRAGLDAMIKLGVIFGYSLFCVPIGWDFALGDNQLTFPDHA